MRQELKHIREASIFDYPILATHHRKMFEDICEKTGKTLEKEKAKEIEKAYLDKLVTEVDNGICKAWVIEDKGEIVSSGAITLVSCVPSPSDLSSKVAYLHSMYTEKNYRRIKCVQKIIHKIIEHCKVNGIKRIFLNASEEGQPVYQKFGFSSAPETMKLFIK